MSDAEDIDRLISELDSASPVAPGAGDAARLDHWMRVLAARNGSV